MPKRALYALIACIGLGCGGGDDDPPTTISSNGTDGGRGSRTCMDEDGDGFGPYCDEGRDCDDDDPSITDECVRCVVPNKGCPCDPGTEPMPGCDPEDMVSTMNGVTGVLVCTEGTRYCRDGAWSDCEILWQYATFVPDT